MSDKVQIFHWLTLIQDCFKPGLSLIFDQIIRAPDTLFFINILCDNRIRYCYVTLNYFYGPMRTSKKVSILHTCCL